MMAKVNEWKLAWEELKDIGNTINDRLNLNNEIYRLFYESKIDSRDTEILETANRELEEYVQDFVTIIESLYEMSLAKGLNDEWENLYSIDGVCCDDGTQIDFVDKLPIDFLQGIVEIFPFAKIEGGFLIMEF